MFALEPKRCPYCVRRLASIPLDGQAEFHATAPLLVCEQCDGAPRPDYALHVPDDWASPAGSDG